MELVCVGLSKNPYVAASYKRNVITWFKDYFERADINEIAEHQGVWHQTNQSTPVEVQRQA